MGKTESKKAAILFSFTLVFCGLSVPFFWLIWHTIGNNQYSLAIFQ
jgi:hypothetical protein